jgi:hypothetical protein
MNPIRHLRGLAAVLAGLAGTWLGDATAAPAAFAVHYPLPANQGQGGIWVIRLGKMGSFADELAGPAWLRLP